MENGLAIQFPPQIELVEGGLKVNRGLSFNQALDLVGELGKANSWTFWASLDIIMEYREHGQAEAFARRLGWSTQTLYNWVSTAKKLKPEHRNLYLTPSHNKVVATEFSGVESGEQAKVILDAFEEECLEVGRRMTCNEFRDYIQSALDSLPGNQDRVIHPMSRSQELEFRNQELEQRNFELSNSLAYAQAQIKEVMPHINGNNLQELKEFVENPIPTGRVEGRWGLGEDGIYFYAYSGEIYKYPDMPEEVIKQLKLRLSII